MTRKKEYYTIDGKEYELSPSMACDPIPRWHIPVCEVCKHYSEGKKECSKLNPIPAEYINFERYDCPQRDIDETHVLYKALKRQLNNK